MEMGDLTPVYISRCRFDWLWLLIDINSGSYSSKTAILGRTYYNPTCKYGRLRNETTRDTISRV
jgi:predicted RNA-binding protein with PUA-like domain